MAWAAGMVAPAGKLRMILLLQEEFQQNVHALMETIAPDVDVDPEALAGALAKTHVRLHRGLQKAAAAAAFGYELDATALPAADRAEVAAQVAWFKRHRDVIQLGRFLRLRSPFEGDGNRVAWMSVAGDRRRSVVGAYQQRKAP